MSSRRACSIRISRSAVPIPRPRMSSATAIETSYGAVDEAVTIVLSGEQTPPCTADGAVCRLGDHPGVSGPTPGHEVPRKALVAHRFSQPEFRCTGRHDAGLHQHLPQEPLVENVCPSGPKSHLGHSVNVAPPGRAGPMFRIGRRLRRGHCLCWRLTDSTTAARLSNTSTRPSAGRWRLVAMRCRCDCPRMSAVGYTSG